MTASDSDDVQILDNFQSKRFNKKKKKKKKKTKKRKRKHAKRHSNNSQPYKKRKLNTNNNETSVSPTHSNTNNHNHNNNKTHAWPKIKIESERTQLFIQSLNTLSSKFLSSSRTLNNPNTINTTNTVTLICNDELQQEKRKNQQLTKLNHTLRLRLHGLKEIALRTGEDPRFNKVKMNKVDKLYSASMYEMKTQINYNNKYEDDTFEIKINTGMDNILDVKQCIVQYLDCNGLDKSKSKLKINEGEYNINYDNVMKEFIIETHRISALVGGNGLKTLINIPKNTCLGQYIGINYTKKEYDEIFNNTNQFDIRNQYAFDQVVMFENEKVEIVIDGFGLKHYPNESCHISMINDCRLDIFNEERPTKEDEKYKNIEFVTCIVNGWPYIFVVSCRDIVVGEEVCGWYGEHFGDAVRDRNEFEKSKAQMRTLVYQILKPITGELNKDVVYDIR